jgi:LuxR family transcriptional regulator, maltose regulon positive regulatory protein
LAQGTAHPGLAELPRIALTKTAPPAVRKSAVQRPALLRILDNAVARRLVLFGAPAGYGKSTLAAEWYQSLQDAGAIVAWLSLDTDDNEPSAFAYHLACAMEAAAPGLVRDTIELLKASSLLPARNVISSLLNAVSEIDAETYLFLEDFHVVSDPRCHGLMPLILRYAPSNLHVVLLSRSEPRFSLSRLRLDDDLVEMDISLLRFTLMETKQFLGEALSCRLGAAGVAKLHSATEGWPAALQLARIALLNSSDPLAHVGTISGATRTISEYFEDTLSTQPEPVINFLLKTSILDQMNGSLCSAVIGRTGGAPMLENLEREQFLVVPLDDHGNWYRYHHLLREFLLDQLRCKMPDELSGIYGRASRWHSERKLWREAVQYAIAAEDYPLALECIENCAMSMVMKGDLLTLLSWEQQLPKQFMSSQLEVKLALAWGMVLVTRFKEAGMLLTQVEAGTCKRPRTDLWWRCRAARAVFCALSDDGASDLEVALECLAGHKFDVFNFNALCNVARYAYLKSGDWNAFYALPVPNASASETSYVMAENHRLCLYGLAAVKQLKFDEALEFYAAAQSLAEKYAGAKSVTASMLTGLIARLQYERGDVAGAEVRVLDTLDLIETTAFHEGFRNAYFVLMRAAAIRGDHIRAVSLLNRAERMSWERGWGVVSAMLLVEHTRVLLTDGNVSEAKALLQTFEELHARHPVVSSRSSVAIRAWIKVSKGLIEAALGNLADAASSLGGAFDALVATGDRFAALSVGVDLTVIHSRSGFSQKAYDLLSKVMSWRAHANMSSFVLDQDQRISPILLQAKEAGVFNEDRETLKFVNGLLNRLQERARETHQPGARPRDELTGRERSIVEFIAQGRSNKEIARELGVAPETIKTHLKRIFQKLSAESRTQAVVRAQSLGVLNTAHAQATM